MNSSRAIRALLHTLVLVGVAALLIFALAGDRGRLAILRVEAARSELERDIATLETQNRELTLEVEQLRRPEFAAERLARETLGLAREGEQVYVDARLVAVPPEAVPSPRASETPAPPPPPKR